MLEAKAPVSPGIARGLLDNIQKERAINLRIKRLIALFYAFVSFLYSTSDSRGIAGMAP